MPTINVLIATIGRESLQIMLDSLVNELKQDDHLTIVFDGTKQKNCDTTKFNCNIHIFEEETNLGYWGHAIRNKYASILEKTDFVMHADDDDRYVPGSFDLIRKTCIDEDILYIFKMVQGPVIPVEGKFNYLGNVGTPNGIIPYKYNSLAMWHLYGGGDGFFYEDLSKKVKNIIWCPFIIYVVQDSEIPSDYEKKTHIGDYMRGITEITNYFFLRTGDNSFSIL